MAKNKTSKSNSSGQNKAIPTLVLAPLNSSRFFCVGCGIAPAGDALCPICSHLAKPLKRKKSLEYLKAKQKQFARNTLWKDFSCDEFEAASKIAVEVPFSWFGLVVLNFFVVVLIGGVIWILWNFS